MTWSAVRRVDTLVWGLPAEEPASTCEEAPWLRATIARRWFGRERVFEVEARDGADGAAEVLVASDGRAHRRVLRGETPVSSALLAMREVVATWMRLDPRAVSATFRPARWSGEDRLLELVDAGGPLEVRLTGGARPAVDRAAEPLEAVSSFVRRRAARPILRRAPDPAWADLRASPFAPEPAEIVESECGLRFAWPVERGGRWVGGYGGGPFGSRRLRHLDGDGPIDLLVAYAQMSHRHWLTDPLPPVGRWRPPAPVARRITSQPVEIGGRRATVSFDWPRPPGRGGGAQSECGIGVDGAEVRAVVTHGDHPWSSLELACWVVCHALHAGDLGALAG